MPVILLVRHGQASFGATDYDRLSATGEQQVAVLHSALGAIADPVLVAGAMRRQRDSAVPWIRHGGELLEDDRWDEYDSEDVLRTHAHLDAGLEADPGAATVSTRAFQEILDPALERWIAAGSDSPARETWPSFRERVLGALDHLAGQLGSGQTAIAFSSGGAIAACCAALLGAPDVVTVALNRTAVNAAFTKVLVGRRGLSLVSYNEHGHLAPDQVTYR